MSTSILRMLIARIAPPESRYGLKAIFADGSVYSNRAAVPEFDVTIHFRTFASQWRTLLMFPNGFFDAYIDGAIDLDGEMPVYVISRLGHEAGVDRAHGRLARWISKSPLALADTLIGEWRQNNIDREQAIRNAEFHYALPVELFRRMLGETLGYSEGIWTPGTRDINQAKHNLYETICRKLDLRPGMKVLEVGSGWGFFPIYMVKNYDVDVIVYNPVEAQNDCMRARFARHGVADRIRLVSATHRDIVAEGSGSVDRFVSIGVHEHHGYDRRMYHLWWEAIAHVLRHGGIGVVSSSTFMTYSHTSRLTLKHVWPGGHIPSAPMEISVLSQKNLTLVEWENAWPDYHRTLCLWRDRFKQNWPEIRDSDPEVFTERFRRRWTFYMELVPETFERWLDCSHFTVVKGRDAATFPRPLRERLAEVRYRTGDDPVECYE